MTAADEVRTWSRCAQHSSAILWCAFLSACVAALVFFALFDPLLLMRDDAPPAWLSDRRSGYALGFFFFWLIGIGAAALTTWLITAGQAEDETRRGPDV